MGLYFQQDVDQVNSIFCLPPLSSHSTLVLLPGRLPSRSWCCCQFLGSPGSVASLCTSASPGHTSSLCWIPSRWVFPQTRLHSSLCSPGLRIRTRQQQQIYVCLGTYTESHSLTMGSLKYLNCRRKNFIVTKQAWDLFEISFSKLITGIFPVPKEKRRTWNTWALLAQN